MRDLDTTTSERKSRGLSAIALLATGSIALTGCGSSPDRKPTTPSNACRPLGKVIDEVQKQQFIHHSAPSMLVQPLRDPELRTVSFGIPADATPAEIQEDQAVINGVHTYVDKHHVINVIVGRTQEIKAGNLGIATFSGNCPMPAISPAQQVA